MALDKSCPGSRAIRNPIPENIACPSCGRDVEIWTDELKATCRNCGTKVFRQQQQSCIDWCPYAKECVGPEVYERLRPGAKEELSGTVLEVIKKDHDRVLENLGLLRGAGLCLQLGTSGASALRERGINHLNKVIEFFDRDVKLHFRREEDVLFPAIDEHLEGERSPTRLLLGEHEEMWRWYEQLKRAAARLHDSEADAASEEIRQVTGHFEKLLREHIRKENDSLLPIAQKLLSEAELEDISRKWRLVNV